MNNSLLSKFLLACLSAVTLIFVVVGSISYRGARSALEESQQNQIDTIKERTRSIVPELIWNEEIEVLEKQARSEVRNPFIAELFILDENGELLLGVKSIGSRATSLIASSSADETAYQKSALDLNGQIVGALLLLADNKYIETELDTILKNTVAVSVAFYLILVGTIVFLMRRLIIAPLKSIELTVAENLAQLASGSKSALERLTVNSEDEIGELSVQFNQFMDQVAERDESLVKALKEAEASHRAKSAFLANMSHEIRTPMNGILGMITLATDGNLDAEQRDLLETASHSGEALLNILNEILDASKIDAGKMQIETIQFDPANLVEEVVDLMGEATHAKGIEIACLLGTHLPQTIASDPTRLRQILTNLISNAVKFTEQGEVLVSVDCVDKALLRIEVQDTGIGIRAEACERIFEGFSQADETTTRKYGGTGLGLSLCKKFVGLMKGEMGVQSSFGQGSTFWVTLPLEPIPDVSTVFEQGQVSSHNTLIVCDNPTIHKVLERYCDDLRSPVKVLANVEDLALQSREWGTYQRVIIDVKEESKAIQALHKVGKSALAPKARFIALCSHAQRGKRNLLREGGFDGFLNKPVRLAKLRLLLCADPVIKPARSLSKLTKDGQQADADKGAGTNSEPDQYDRRHVLVVEDNLINQKVAQGMLKKLGCAVEIANNGQEALDILAQKHFDLVFMDCQMPVLDGLEATRKIREFEATEGRQFQPIVAITAHALVEHREASLSAGMNDHITKPVSKNVLARMLDTWAAP